MPPEDIKPPEPTSSDESVVAVYIEDLPQHLPPQIHAPEKTRQDQAGAEQEEDSFISQLEQVGKWLAKVMAGLAIAPALFSIGPVKPPQESRDVRGTVLVMNDKPIGGLNPPANAEEDILLQPYEVNPNPSEESRSSDRLAALGILRAAQPTELVLELVSPELIIRDMVMSGDYTLPPQRWLDVIDITRSFLNGVRAGLPSSAEELGKQIAERLVEKGIDHGIEIGIALATAIITKLTSSSSSSKEVSTISLREKK